MTHLAYIEELIGTESYNWTQAECEDAKALAKKYDTLVEKALAA